VAAALFLLGAALPELRVTVREGRLTVHADKAPLYGVLWAISAQTEIQLKIAEDEATAGPAVTADFKDLPIDEGIHRLLRRHLKQSNYMLVTDAQGQLTEVHILAGAASSSSPGGASPGPAPRAGVGPPAGDGLSGTSPEPVEQALETATTATDHKAQIKALRSLGYGHDPRILAVLRAALRAERADVRHAALRAMRDGTVYDDVTAMADVRSVAASDPDTSVRQAALDVLVIYDEGTEARTLLRALARDTRSPHHAFAKRELDRMEAEHRYRTGPDTQLEEAVRANQTPRQ
jgi:hypothetical protein